MVRKLIALGCITLSINIYANEMSNVSKEDAASAKAIFEASQSALQAGKESLSNGYVEELMEENTNLQKDLVGLGDDDGFNKIGESLGPNNEITYKILVSSAMGDIELKRLFKDFSHRKDVSFVIRGLLPTERTINDVSKRIYGLLKDFSVPPLVYLDPNPFKDVNVLATPTIIAYQGKEVINYAVGLTSPNYLYEQMTAGKLGNLGRFGKTVKASENDIIEELKSRASKLDTKKLVKEAKDSYWDKVKNINLPNATETITRTFEPVMTIQDDIVGANGEMIAFAGTQFNTLEKVPFSLRLVFFDATNPAQVEFVKSLSKSSLRTKYITTKFDSKLKWDAIKTIEKEINAPVYKLTRDLVTSFDLRAIPSVITADQKKKVFLINEYFVTETNASEEKVN